MQAGLGLLGVGLERPGLAVDVRDADLARLGEYRRCGQLQARRRCSLL